jgi:hypothetical protein
MNIEWNKIVGNAISALVVAVFVGAAAIVWRGATTVDDKVQNTREDMTHLITALSDKLAGYETQLSSLSNQLEVVIRNQSNLVTVANQPTAYSHLPFVPVKPHPEIQVNQAAQSEQIRSYLKRKE